MKSGAISDTEPYGRWRLLEAFSGQTAGVDFSGYAYRALQQCSGWYDLESGTITHDYSACCMWIASKLELLVGSNVRPLIVWDGLELQSKGQHASAERREKREIAESKLAAFIELEGDLKSQEGERLLKGMAKRCAEYHTQSRAFFAAKGYVCQTAPGEADAALCGLQRRRITDLTITGDADLLVFGCEVVVFDVLNKRLGTDCYVVSMSDVINDTVHYDSKSLDSASATADDAGDGDGDSDDDDDAAVAQYRALDKKRGRSVVKLLRASGPANRARNHQIACIVAYSDYSPGIKGVGVDTAARLVHAMLDACAKQRSKPVDSIVLTPSLVSAGLERYLRVKYDAHQKPRPTGSNW